VPAGLRVPGDNYIRANIDCMERVLKGMDLANRRHAGFLDARRVWAGIGER
jgi:hypothetical protein